MASHICCLLIRRNGSGGTLTWVNALTATCVEQGVDFYHREETDDSKSIEGWHRCTRRTIETYHNSWELEPPSTSNETTLSLWVPCRFCWTSSPKDLSFCSRCKIVRLLLEGMSDERLARSDIAKSWPELRRTRPGILKMSRTFEWKYTVVCGSLSRRSR
jgi:hypothetical protein